MNQEDIIKMAMEADGHMNNHARGIDMDWTGIERLVQAAYAAGAAAEREACAKVCEELRYDGYEMVPYDRVLASRIRARGNT